MNASERFLFFIYKKYYGISSRNNKFQELLCKCLFSVNYQDYSLAVLGCVYFSLVWNIDIHTHTHRHSHTLTDTVVLKSSTFIQAHKSCIRISATLIQSFCLLQLDLPCYNRNICYTLMVFNLRNFAPNSHQPG